jgi:pimeloyl-ACP methyl ester carboxylesterase
LATADRLTCLVLASLLFAATASAQTSSAPTAAPTEEATPPEKNNYGDPATWLCRPGVKDACDVDMTTTVIAANGKMTTEKWKPNPNAPVDCFYVYPTVSVDPTPNSDMIPGTQELNVVKAQFVRLGSQCRLYAPLYRQITLTALRSMMSGKPLHADRALGYNDVLDAWNYYLQHDNHGRGVVLIGHSQGSYVLAQLLAKEIDGKPIQSQLISAVLMGADIAVPEGEDVGGTFKSIPLCHSATQLGCVISYVSFRKTSPPPENSRFGRVAGEGMVSACTNPAALGGGSGEMHSYFWTAIRNPTDPAQASWLTPPKPIETPFVSTPGLVTAQCVHEGQFSYLEITVHGDPADPRADDIAGDVVINGTPAKDWGLHLIDANLAMGDLEKIVALQSKAYRAKK